MGVQPRQHFLLYIVASPFLFLVSNFFLVRYPWFLSYPVQGLRDGPDRKTQDTSIDELNFANMGGCGSKHHSHLETVDDSVHVMLKHDKKVQKTKGKTEQGYVPRAAHPALQKKEETGYVPRAPHPAANKPVVAAEEE